MFSNLEKIKRVSPMLAISAVFFLLAIGTIVLPFKGRDPEGAGTKTIHKEITLTPTPTQTQEASNVLGENKVLAPTSTPTKSIAVPNNTGSQSQNSTSQQATNAIPSPTSTPQQTQNIQVILSVNGSSVGLVNVASGVNQCDVLTSALSQGKIQSLNMRYVDSLGTYGVYQINGIGKENSVWWTYKVNGTSPSQGCSYIKAGSNDNIEWTYIGN